MKLELKVDAMGGGNSKGTKAKRKKKQSVQMSEDEFSKTKNIKAPAPGKNC